MAKTTIHRSNHDVNVAKRSRFLAWAKNHPELAWEQAVEEPWKMAALRRYEGKAAAEAIRAVHLDALRVAEAKLASYPKPSPASKAAQADLRKVRQRYAEVKEALEPRRRHR
ncbi:hypothetical protein FBF30_02375 [Candidatus Saccharibacteria bacterium oral taxon 955]|nr:hypothetical protein FBF30_02375 [Candidatus Saccharibacteria bacterium oral taxon 955]